MQKKVILKIVQSAIATTGTDSGNSDVLSLTAFGVGMYTWLVDIHFMLEGTLTANNRDFSWTAHTGST